MTRWRMSVYDLALGGGRVVLPGPAWRFVYVLSGLVRARSELGEEVADAESGLLTQGDVELGGAAAAWLYEVDGTAASPCVGEGLSVTLSVAFELPDGPRLIRADRVETPPGIISPRHGHRGPGIRRLLHGRIQAEIGEEHRRIEAGQAWFEGGHDPVVGTNISQGHNSFVRVMLLPPELAGGVSSFVPMSQERAGRPSAVKSTVLAEAIIG